MALTGLDIYKQLPKTNCGECGSPTCLAFAMQLAAKKTSLDKCPHMSEEGRAALEGASAPPIRLVTIGTGDKKVEIGNETVLFRHEETFYHETAIAIAVADNLSEDALGASFMTPVDAGQMPCLRQIRLCRKSDPYRLAAKGAKFR